MNRIEERLAALKEEGKKAFITYTTAGLPDYDTTKKLMFAQEKAGIDIMEIGVPFSDPIADGPVIQDASYKAIQNGASLEGTFTMMGEVRKAGLNSPVVFMLYYNTVYHYGVENFVNKCIENGVDGLIIPDLPFEEQGQIKDVLAKNENSPILIQLVSPVSKGRIPMLLENARGFVYCVSQMGVTGKGANFHSQIREYLTEVKKSDADAEAAKWQLLYYLKVLKTKGVIRKGKLEFAEKNKKDKKIIIIELTDEVEKELDKYIDEIEQLLNQDRIPECINKSTCKKCAYYEYCYI